MTSRTLVLAALVVSACASAPSAADGGGGPPDVADAASPGDATAADASQCVGSTTTPGARGDAVGVVDPETGALWVVGGDVGPTVMCVTQAAFSAEVWRYDPDCDRWTQRMLDGGPSARGRASAALDSRRRRLVLFGGRYRAEGTTGNYTLYNEVWALDLATETWQPIAATGGPSGRANASAVYDPVADELVVFGGNTSRSGLTFTPQADTWALNLGTGTWRTVPTTGTAPSARLFHAAAVRDGRMVVFGGGGANAFQGPFFSDAYALELATGAWSRLALTGDRPLGRISHALVADAVTPRFLLLGGHDDGTLGNRNDVLAIAPQGAVTTLTQGDTMGAAAAGFCSFPADFATQDPNAPERRSAFVAAVDARRNRALVFGGKTDCGSANDVWSVDLATGGWRPLHTTNVGVSCQRAGRTACSALCN